MRRDACCIHLMDITIIWSFPPFLHFSSYGRYAFPSGLCAYTTHPLQLDRGLSSLKKFLYFCRIRARTLCTNLTVAPYRNYPTLCTLPSTTYRIAFLTHAFNTFSLKKGGVEEKIRGRGGNREEKRQKHTRKRRHDSRRFSSVFNYLQPCLGIAWTGRRTAQSDDVWRGERMRVRRWTARRTRWRITADLRWMRIHQLLLVLLLLMLLRLRIHHVVIEVDRRLVGYNPVGGLWIAVEAARICNLWHPSVRHPHFVVGIWNDRKKEAKKWVSNVLKSDAHRYSVNRADWLTK